MVQSLIMIVSIALKKIKKGSNGYFIWNKKIVNFYFKLLQIYIGSSRMLLY